MSEEAEQVAAEAFKRHFEADERSRAEWAKALSEAVGGIALNSMAHPWLAKLDALHDYDAFTDTCRRCTAPRKAVDDGLAPICSKEMQDEIRAKVEAMSSSNYYDVSKVLEIIARHSAPPVAVEDWDRPMSRSIIDEWTRRK